MSARSQPLSPRPVSKDSRPSSAPESSPAPSSKRSARAHSSNASDYTEDSEDPRVRAAGSPRPSEPPEVGEGCVASTQSRAAEVVGSTVSMLSRYFRDMATHQVMGPDEELSAAQGVELAEIEHWVALLAYVPA